MKPVRLDAEMGGFRMLKWVVFGCSDDGCCLVADRAEMMVEMGVFGGAEIRPATGSGVPDAYGLEVSIGLLKATGHALAVKNIEKVGEDELGRRLAELEARGQIYVLSSLSRLCLDAVTKSLTPLLDGSRRRRFMPATPFPRSVSNTSSRIWCRPQLKITQMKDKVVQNNSQVKFKNMEVEDHDRISSFSNKTKSVTACNDNLKPRTSNVNVVCVTCGKYVFNSNHDSCDSKFLNDVNTRSKNPQEVPIRTRKPIRKANQSVA
ncbi:hypothetical protein Tco_1499666 [Tanacetum coccineum]